MLHSALTKYSDADISYGIYTIERLPKGSRRSPKWDLHSVAKDRATAENHARTLSAQPYYDHIEVQEFRVCPDTKKRTVSKVRTYSRNSSGWWITALMILAGIIAIIIVL